MNSANDCPFRFWFIFGTGSPFAFDDLKNVESVIDSKLEEALTYNLPPAVPPLGVTCFFGIGTDLKRNDLVPETTKPEY